MQERAMADESDNAPTGVQRRSSLLYSCDDYILSTDERAALDEARGGPVASEEEVAALWRRLGVG